MSKNTHFTGPPLYSQLLSLVNKDEIANISRNGNHDRYVKKLDGYSHFVILLYGVLIRHDSLREIVIGMLSEANNRRKSEFFEQIYFSLYHKYKESLADGCANKDWENMLTYAVMIFTGQQ